MYGKPCRTDEMCENHRLPGFPTPFAELDSCFVRLCVDSKRSVISGLVDNPAKKCEGM
jgi:hypothetical protein